MGLYNLLYTNTRKLYFRGTYHAVTRENAGVDQYVHDILQAELGSQPTLF